MIDENINPNAEGGHTEMYGICENKCFVPVSPKTDTDAVKNRVTALEPRVTAVETNKQNKNLYFTNVSASSWANDATYTTYPYKCTIPLNGVTSNDVADVVFNLGEATNGQYAPICQTYDGGVYIWSKINTAITIPTIIIHKGA